MREIWLAVLARRVIRFALPMPAMLGVWALGRSVQRRYWKKRLRSSAILFFSNYEEKFWGKSAMIGIYTQKRMMCCVRDSNRESVEVPIAVQLTHISIRYL